MRGSRHYAALVATLATVAVSAPAAATAGGAGDGPTATAAAACKPATIAGKRTCLKRGLLCTRKYERQYLRYSFSCRTKDSRGRYHLAVRSLSF